MARRWGGGALLRLGMVGLVFGSVGFAYVALKNEQTRLGRKKEKMEKALLKVEEEIRMTKGRVASLLERGRMKERLKRGGSSLRPISTDEVIELLVESEVPGQVSDVAYGEQEGGR